MNKETNTITQIEIRVTELLKIMRLFSNYTQEYVATRMGISATTYNAWESGQTRLRLNNIYQLAKIYNVSPENILDEDVTELIVKLFENHGFKMKNPFQDTLEELKEMVKEVLVLLENKT